MSKRTVSVQFINKIIVSFLLVALVMALSFIGMTWLLSNKFFEESTQQLNAGIANHLIDEKFQNNSPFLENGEVNKALFGDLMHDMMAVNRAIEVYLLDIEGNVLYSVVLDHSDAEKAPTQIATGPLDDFIASDGEKYICAQDPKNPEEDKIFSAAKYNVDGREGYVYVLLASSRFDEVSEQLAGSYFIQFGALGTLGILLFGGIIGVLAIWLLSKNLREIIATVQKFKEGDLKARIDKPGGQDLSLLAETFNEMADTLLKNIDELKSLESLRRELIANVSHDLRTPLAITQGYVETLQLKSDSLSVEERDKYLTIIEKSIQKLSKLINQLFEYSKLEAKQIEPQKEAFSIKELAFDIQSKYEQLASKKNISIELNAESNLPSVYADIALVERVIQNLIDNAIKFTPEGGRIVLNLNSDNQNVKIAVEDNGIGIDSENLTHIFERTHQVESAKEHNKGAGLGLAIVKKIMDLHETTINVQSTPNQGTVFQFSLPVV